MALYVQAIINGILIGGVYSLMAVGLSLIFGVMRVINFAHGDMMVWGMYLSLWLFIDAGRGSLPFDPLHRRRRLPPRGGDPARSGQPYPRRAPHEMQILLMMGVALVLENLALMTWGPDPRRVNVSLRPHHVLDGSRSWWTCRALVTFALALVLALVPVPVSESDGPGTDDPGRLGQPNRGAPGGDGHPQGVHPRLRRRGGLRRRGRESDDAPLAVHAQFRPASSR